MALQARIWVALCAGLFFLFWSGAPQAGDRDESAYLDMIYGEVRDLFHIMDDKGLDGAEQHLSDCYDSVESGKKRGGHLKNCFAFDMAVSLHATMFYEALRDRYKTKQVTQPEWTQQEVMKKRVMEPLKMVLRDEAEEEYAFMQKAVRIVLYYEIDRRGKERDEGRQGGK